MIDVDGDQPYEECGVFGIWAPGLDVARTAFFALYALQHRGQESAGIATTDGQRAFSIEHPREWAEGTLQQSTCSEGKDQQASSLKPIRELRRPSGRPKQIYVL